MPQKIQEVTMHRATQSQITQPNTLTDQISISSKSTFPNVEFGTAKPQHMIQHFNMYKCELKTNSYSIQEGKIPITVQ